jgi:flagellar biosynthesis/type III secretory pathway chaperone
MKSKIEDLEQLMQAQQELSEALADIMVQKQRAILGLQSDALMELTRREEELISPMNTLEHERARMVEEIQREAGVKGKASSSVRELVRYLPPKDAVRVSSRAARLRSVVERILSINEQNRQLLQRSQRFVNDAIRLITEDNTRQLVDQKM